MPSVPAGGGQSNANSEVSLKKKKDSFFKYFEPINIMDAIDSHGTDRHSIDEGLGYFAFSPRKEKLFLNRFSPREILDISKSVGLNDHLAKLGFTNLQAEVEKDETLIHYLKIYNGEVSPYNLLIDLRLSESRFIPDAKLFQVEKNAVTLDMIVIEWLSAENPSNIFDPTRPQLPGQKKPGLGCLNYLMEMMYIVGREVIKDGFMDIPDHLHGAIMYSRKFKFFDPVQEAILRAIVRDLEGRSLMDISWGMITGTIIDETTGKQQVYDPAEQVYPLSRRIKKYFSSSAYEKRLKEVFRKKKYRFDYEKMQELRAHMLKSKSVIDL
jgi:hypothetical protein